MAYLQCNYHLCNRFFKGRASAKYCSDDCKLAAQEERRQKAPLIEKVCANPSCGKSFKTRRKAKTYCCLACKKEVEHEKYSAPTEEKACAYCNNKFEGTKREKYCSRQCAEQAKRERDKDRDNERNKSKRIY